MRVASAAATVAGPEMESATEPVTIRSAQRLRPLDDESLDWLRSLRGTHAVREAAISRLHALLLRAARFEVARRRPTLPHLRGNELDEIALEAADDALMSVLARLDDFRGASRFTTWVYKFALNGVPIDVLAERLNTTRGALYKTLHDARQKLRKHLHDSGAPLETWLEEET